MVAYKRTLKNMNKKILKYRQKHKKCKYCKYYHVDGASWMGIFYDHCKAKDIVFYSSVNRTIIILPKDGCLQAYIEKYKGIKDAF